MRGVIVKGVLYIFNGKKYIRFKNYKYKMLMWKIWEVSKDSVYNTRPQS